MSILKRFSSLVVIGLLLVSILPISFPSIVSAATGSSAVYSTSSDGYIESLNGSLTAYSNTSTGKIGGYRTGTGGGIYHYNNGYFYFDTSTLPAGVTVTSATLFLYGVALDNTVSFSLVIQDGMPTYPHDPLVTGDFTAGNYSGNGGSLASSIFTVGQYNAINLNSAGLSWINVSGTTKFCIRTDNDINGTALVNPEYCSVDMQESGSSTAPYLSISYTTTIPTVTVSAATMTGPTSAVLNGNVTSLGSYLDTTVTFYWGLTDGGQTPSNWTNHATPGSPTQPQTVAAFSLTMSSLSPHTTYYYSASVSGSGYVGWPTASTSFTTGGSYVAGGVTFQTNLTALDTSGTARTYYPVSIPVNISGMQSQGMMGSGLDTSLYLGTTAQQYMPTTSAIYVCATSLGAYQGLQYTLYSNYSPVQTAFPIIVGDGGYVTVADFSPEPGSSFSIVMVGYLDTTAGSSKNLFTKASAITCNVDSSTSGKIDVAVTGGGSTFVTGVTPGVYTITVSLSGGTLTLTVGSATSSVASSAVASNASPWVINQNNAMPYITSYTETVSGTEKIKYQPNAIISGTTLPNLDSGGSYPGAITFGANTGITTSVGSTSSVTSFVPGMGTSSSPIGAPPNIPGYIENNTTEPVTMPEYDLFHQAATALGWGTWTLYGVIEIFVAIGLGVGVGVATGSTLLAAVAVFTGLVMGAGTGQLGWWVVICYGIIGMSIIGVTKSI